MKTISIALLTFAALCATSGQVLFKLGAQGNVSYSDYLNSNLLLGALFYVLGTAIWIYVLSYERLIDVYAFSALTFIFVYLGGAYFLKEKISLVGFSGIALVILGLYLVISSSNQT